MVSHECETARAGSGPGWDRTDFIQICVAGTPRAPGPQHRQPGEIGAREASRAVRPTCGDRRSNRPWGCRCCCCHQTCTPSVREPAGSRCRRACRRRPSRRSGSPPSCRSSLRRPDSIRMTCRGIPHFRRSALPDAFRRGGHRRPRPPCWSVGPGRGTRYSRDPERQARPCCRGSHTSPWSSKPSSFHSRHPSPDRIRPSWSNRNPRLPEHTRRLSWFGRNHPPSWFGHSHWPTSVATGNCSCWRPGTSLPPCRSPGQGHPRETPLPPTLRSNASLPLLLSRAPGHKSRLCIQGDSIRRRAVPRRTCSFYRLSDPRATASSDSVAPRLR
jgi:hypothetical protein